MMVIVVGTVWWGGPALRAVVPMARPEWDGLAPEVRASAEGQFRLALIQAAAALALACTAQNYRLSRRGQVTDRFTKALERLGSDELDVRIGGVFALEQIVQDSPDQATHAAQVLNAFIRRRVPPATAPADSAAGRGAMGAAALREALNRTAPDPWPQEVPDADVQAALTALTFPGSRRHIDPAQTADLTWLCLTNARLDGANLTGAQLHDANLTNSGLHSANLTNAWLHGTNLTGAHLHEADFTNADLDGANLTNAQLYSADLTHCRSLTVEQAVSAFPRSDTKLPPDIAAHPDVIARLAGVEDARP
ncbi:pentapeptide repeat-containing protein [Streptomyces sp. NPDC087420]|uniref:pentapeptide repeat-containing protein n=1 Tax=Streptomyces sp. NPDC087420 TaxID=3365785 RepID=UPI00383592B5